MYCTRCGAELSQGTRFCRNCGAAIAGDTLRQTAAEAVVSQDNAHGLPPLVERDSAVVSVGKVLAKNLALSTVVLVPGFTLLLAPDTRGLGMVWLLLGSFAMLAWTYRKPWRLGIVSCLVPPVTAVICYLVQLELFGTAIPDGKLILGAALIGVAIGWARGQANNVYRENGRLFAQRTLVLLTIWVIAYGLTQVLALIGGSVWMVHAGLATGALSTASLTAAAVLLLWKRVRMGRAVGAAAVLLGCTGALFSASPAAAELVCRDRTEWRQVLCMGLPAGSSEYRACISAWTGVGCVCRENGWGSPQGATPSMCRGEQQSWDDGSTVSVPEEDVTVATAVVSVILVAAGIVVSIAQAISGGVSSAVAAAEALGSGASGASGTRLAQASGSSGRIPGMFEVVDRIGRTLDTPEETEQRQRQMQNLRDKIKSGEGLWRTIVAVGSGLLTYAPMGGFLGFANPWAIGAGAAAALVSYVLPDALGVITDWTTRTPPPNDNSGN